MTPGNREGAYVAPDLVHLVNDKQIGFFFVPGEKIGPGESALVLRTTAEFIIHKGGRCHIEERARNE